MNTLSEKDEWLSHFNYENLQQQIPGLTEKDFSLLIHGKPTKDVYDVHDCLGRVSLNLNATSQTATFGILTAERHPGIPEYVSNTLLGDKERLELEQGKYIPLHNNRVAYYNKEKNCVFSESVSNYSLPGKIGNTELSLQQKCKLLNGDKLVVQQNGLSVISEKTKDKTNFSYTPKGLNPEQIDFLATYKTNSQSRSVPDQEKLNSTIIHALGKRYFPNEDPKKLNEKLKKEIGTKGNLEESLKEWFILRNNQQVPEIKHEKKKETAAIYDQADNPRAVQNKLKHGMKNFHHKVEKSMSKGKEFTSTLIQGM